MKLVISLSAADTPKFGKPVSAAALDKSLAAAFKLVYNDVHKNGRGNYSKLVKQVTTAVVAMGPKLKSFCKGYTVVVNKSHDNSMSDGSHDIYGDFGWTVKSKDPAASDVDIEFVLDIDGNGKGTLELNVELTSKTAKLSKVFRTSLAKNGGTIAQKAFDYICTKLPQMFSDKAIKAAAKVTAERKAVSDLARSVLSERKLKFEEVDEDFYFKFYLKTKPKFAVILGIDFIGNKAYLSVRQESRSRVGRGINMSKTVSLEKCDLAKFNPRVLNKWLDNANLVVEGKK